MSKSSPTMAWEPKTGESKIFNHPDDVPAGWLDTHPDNLASVTKPEPDKAPDAPTKAAPLPLTRKEMVKALQDGGIAFDPAAKVDVLYSVLTEAVQKFLITAEIEFDPALDTKALLALVPPTE